VATRRFADARDATDQREGTLAVQRALQPALQAAQRVGAPDQDRLSGGVSWHTQPSTAFAVG